MIKSLITDPTTGRQAHVVSDEDNINAVVVATRELKTYSNVFKFFTNLTYGSDMNQDGRFSGNSISVHNGGDSTLWTATDISGNWTFDSTDEFHTGSQSIKGKDTRDNNTAQIAKGDSQDLTGYVAVTGWVLLTKATSGSGVILYGWDTGTGVAIGNEVNILDKVNQSVVDVWQSFSFTFVEMGIVDTTIDAFRIRAEKGSNDPDFYLDDIQIEEIGEPIEYTIDAYPKREYLLTDMKITFVDAYDSTVVNGTMSGIPYDGILGVNTLTNGILLNFNIGGSVVSYVLSDLIDFIEYPDVDISNFGSDGVNTWVTISHNFNTPIKITSDDTIKFIIQDDLSGLLRFRASVELLFEDE